MAAARVADGAKCLAGKKDSGDFSVWSSSSFSSAAFSFIAARPLVAELGRAAGSGIEHLSNEVVFIVALTSSPINSPTFSARNPASKRQLSDHILCERQRSDVFPASVLHPDSEPRAAFRCLHPDWLPK